MQTRTLGDLILLIESLLGGTFNNVSEMRIVLRLINRRLTTAYNRTQSWPRYLEVGEKRDIAALEVTGITNPSTASQYYKLVGLANSTNSVEAGTEVYQGITTTTTGIFRSTLSADNEWRILKDITFTEETDGTITVGSQDYVGDLLYTQANETITDDIEDAPWSAVNGTGTPVIRKYNLIPYAQSGLNTIGEFIRIHRRRPFLNQSQIEYDFYLDENGANILNVASTTDNEAFPTYKKQLTLITHTESGADDDAVRDGYRTSSSTVPNEFFSYLAHSSFADLLRAESQFEDALREEAVAENYLSAELEKLDIIANNNNLKKKFSTHLNRNSR